MQTTLTPARPVCTRIKGFVKWSALLYLPLVCVLALAAYASNYYHIPLVDLFQDPPSVTGAPTYVGVVSNIGVLFWTATVAICLFSAYLLSARSRHRASSQFCLWSGCITGILLIDDFFMLHDSVLYVLFGINENIVFLVYIGLIGGYLVWFRHTLLSTPFPLLLAALGLFTISTVFDKVPGVAAHLGLPIPFTDNDNVLCFVEEGSKLAAIVSWFGYYLQTCVEYLQ